MVPCVTGAAVRKYYVLSVEDTGVMATRQTPPTSHHRCSCGENFDSTDELLAHAREDHGLYVH